MDVIDISELLGVDPAALPSGAVGAHLVDLHRARAVLDARIAETAGVVDVRKEWAIDGARSGPAFVTARVGTSYGRAKGDQVIGRAVRDMPAVAAAFAAGRLSREQVDALVKARDGLEEVFAAMEEALVDEVAGSTLAAGARFLRRWAAEVRERLGLDDDGSEPPDTAGVHLSSTLDGRWALRGDLDPEQGEIIANAVDAEVDAMWRSGRFSTDDGLCPAERRAIALVEVVARGTRGGDDDGTARPLVIGIVDLRPHPDATVDDHSAEDGDDGMDDLFSDLVDDAFAPDDTDVPGGPGPIDADLRPGGSDTEDGAGFGRVTVEGLAELERSGVVPRSTLERWMCEGTFQPLIIGPGPDGLRLGRKVRIANREQRRALRGRDGGCGWSGCDVPAIACQAHHIVWWEHGGPTDIENLVLLCRFHHRLVHDLGFTITRTDGTITVRRPDGTPVTGTLRAACDRRRARPPPRGREPDDNPEPVAISDARLARCRIDQLIVHARTRRSMAAAVTRPA